MLVNKWTLSVAIAAAALGSGCASTASLSAASSHDDGVMSDVWVQSRRPLLDLASEVHVQVVAYSVVFRNADRVLLSQLHAQRVLPADSDYEICEDVIGIHPGLGATATASGSAPHDYRLSIRPAAGLTWGEANERSQILFDVVRIE